MPSFSFTPIKKPTTVKSHADSSSKYNIIVPDTEGTVFITLKGTYVVVIGADMYNIASECYSCKGISTIYSQELINGKTRTRYIRDEKRERGDRDRNMYLPFTAGCCVKGNIVRHKAANTIIFKIKKVFLDFNDPIARQAIKFYRDHYVEIRKVIDSKNTNNQLSELKTINE